jgi:hypothetical protein
MKQLSTIAIFILLVAQTALGADKRSRTIDFDEALVEGVNRRPLDSLSHIADDAAMKNKHLYRERKGFKNEIQEALREMRSVQ